MTTDFLGLGRFELFREFDQHELGEIGGLLRRRVFADGAVVVEQGGYVGGAFVLLSGQVRVERSLPNSKTVDLTVLNPGRAFGLLSLMDGGSRAARCVARGTAVCVELPRQDCLDLVSSRSPLALRFQLTVLRSLFNDLREANGRLAVLAALPDETEALIDLD